jgi:1,3-beta-glucanosyltransferase GAS1
MYSALACVPSDNLPDDELGSLFGIVCGLGTNVCNGIKADANAGDYGAYGMCNPTQQLGWALNAYYQEQVGAGNGASACDFSGSAKTQAATEPTGTCANLISQAGSNGQGTVTSGPSGTGSGSGSGSSSNAGSPGVSQPSNFGILQAGIYGMVAAVSLVGMIVL